jgi:hypothetical protein
MRVFLPGQFAIVMRFLENGENESTDLPSEKKTWKK